MASFSSVGGRIQALRPRPGSSAGADRLPRLLQGEHHRHQPLLRAVVEVALQPTALFLGGGHDPRPRLGDQLQLLLQLGLQALVLQRQPQDPGHGRHQLRLVEQRRVVDEGRHRLVRVAHQGHAPRLVRPGQLGNCPVLRDPAAVHGRAQELQRRITQRPPQRIAGGAAPRLIQSGGEPTQRSGRGPHPQDGHQDRNGNQHARREQAPAEEPVGHALQLQQALGLVRGGVAVLEGIERGGAHGQDAGHQDRSPRALEHGTCAQQANDHHDTHRRRERGNRVAADDLGGLPGGEIGPEGEGVRRAVGAAEHRCRVEEEQPTERAEGEGGREADDQPARLQALRPRGEDQQQGAQHQVVVALEGEADVHHHRLPGRRIAADVPEGGAGQEHRSSR